MNRKIKKILIFITIVIAGIFIAGGIVYQKQRKAGKQVVVQVSEKELGFLSRQEAAEKAVNYINQNILEKGATASLINASEEYGFYRIHLKIGESEFNSYVTRDGKFLFPEVYNLEEKPKTAAEAQPEPKKSTCEDIKKVEKPVLEAFVVSKCPYGLQMQRVLNEIVKNIPSLANNIGVEYIGSIENGKITSMHGEEEAQENLRQICLREEQSDKYWKYIDCHIKKGDVESCVAEAGIDKNKLDSCLKEDSKGLKYAKEDFDLQEKYKVGGSPTLILNGEKANESNFGGRAAEAVKTLLCCGFQTTPSACSQKLTEIQAAAGFSETYSSPSSSGEGGCE
jgi:hypothetical protein